ncbi:AraC family transcriptional regulator [Paraburkholderia sp.]|uniref:AraC family transcriptional regulator n=1 Tax=Paraburkholderia sp. TaxID=1926495 RepID=UPI0023A26E06|nr:AraC family transcriptional regulator [Paraburkholderia sp.]MDE1182068.1 AraC family transcriptional regulator [Paraburkholderia sp.]
MTIDHHPAVTAPCVALRRYGAVEATDVHDFHQVVLGLDGAMVMTVDGIGQQIDAGSAWLIPAGARHDYAGLGDNRQLVLDLPATSVAVPERLFDRARAVSVDPAVTQLVQRIAARAGGDTASAGFAGIAGGAMRRFHWDAAARLCAAILADDRSTSSAATNGVGLDFARIDRWMRAHLSEPLRIADLAAHCGFGMRRFHQLFNDAFGETPGRYLQRLRLDVAVTLLADRKLSLSEVALEVGFGDQSAFNHAFTRRFGVAPGGWRGE